MVSDSKIMKDEDLRIEESFNAPEPVPAAAKEAVEKMLATGDLFRYNREDNNSPVSLLEDQLANYTGHKYCVALNSCGSALFLACKAVGIGPGDKVLGNCITFGAVPSAVFHAGGEFVFVESTRDVVIDVDDLVKKADSSGAKFLMVSHMRGRVAHMQRISEICAERGITIVEDCAHSLGVFWGDEHTGHKGKVCCISSQSYKMINSGEGGFALTNDEECAAKMVVMAGGYETNFKKHIRVPGAEVFAQLVPQKYANYSMRMSNLTAATLPAQIANLEERIVEANAKFNRLNDLFANGVEAMGDLGKLAKAYFPKVLPEVRSVFDSLQFTMDVPDHVRDDFIAGAKSRGVPLGVFGAAGNARNYVAWQFLGEERVKEGMSTCPKSLTIVKQTYDVRIPAQFAIEKMDVMASILLLSLTNALTKYSEELNSGINEQERHAEN